LLVGSTLIAGVFHHRHFHHTFKHFQPVFSPLIFSSFPTLLVLNHFFIHCYDTCLKVGLELERSFGGQAANLVKSAENSAATLIELITRHFPGKSTWYYVQK